MESSRDKPIIWTTGPPGCGKTTLIASYLDSCKIPSLWYKVDRGDADIATFFYYMGLAAKKAAPHKRRPLPLLTPEYLLGISTFTLRYFEELYSRLKTPFFIVKATGDMINQGDIDGACQQLRDACLRTDGMTLPPDFVKGPSSPTLASMIQDLMATLGCN